MAMLRIFSGFIIKTSPVNRAFLLGNILLFFRHFSNLSYGVRCGIVSEVARKRVRQSLHARVAELVDALASGASVHSDVEVQVLFRAPNTDPGA